MRRSDTHERDHAYDMMEDYTERGRGSKGAKKSRGRNGTKQGIN